jgi:hypothetical protein
MCGTWAEIEVQPVPQGRLINRLAMVNVVAGFCVFPDTTTNNNSARMFKILIRRKFGFGTK